ncbi:MAG: PspC domain-containing protein [Chloroflexi bacterium]|nr:PspC domain-containing protein [Chloroflexota bacterium]
MKRLYRSRKERMIAGVCAGLGDYLQIDPTIVRIIFIALVFAGLGGVVVYFILWIVTPEEPLPGDTIIDVNNQEK